MAPPSNIVEMEYPKDENHNPLVCELRTKPVAEEFECGYFPNRNDFQLFYRCWKLKNSSVHETQTVVVHVHGITSHSEMSIQLADGLVSDDKIVISFDLHGHGYSEGVRGDYKRFKGFIEDLEDFLFFAYDKYSQKNFVLSGESMGGLVVALYMILIYQDSLLPIKKIVFWAPAFGLNLSSGWAKDLGFGLRFGFNLLFDQSKKAIPVDHSKTFKNPVSLKVHNRESTMLKFYSSRYLWKIFEAINKLKTFGGSEKLSVPFIVFHGTKDYLVSQSASYEFFRTSPVRKKSKYVRLEGVWHHIFSDPGFTKLHWNLLKSFLSD